MEACYQIKYHRFFRQLRMVTSFALLIPGITAFAQPAEQMRINREVLSALNQVRREAGLDTVSLSAELSRGCYNHAKYLVINKGRHEIEGLRAHEERNTLKGYTPEGEIAGRQSVITFVLPEYAITSWLNTFYHRIALIMPYLKFVGFGYYRQGDDVACVLDWHVCGAPPDKRAIVYCPSPNQIVTTAVYDKELPDPIPQCNWFDARGFPVTITFTENMKLTEVSFKLTDNHNEPVDCWFSTPEKPSPGNMQGNSICAIPKGPLKSGTTFTVTLHCKINGAVFDKQYSFKTVGRYYATVYAKPKPH